MPWSMCQEGTFAKSFRLRIDTFHGTGVLGRSDDTGLNAIELQCAGANGEYASPG